MSTQNVLAFTGDSVETEFFANVGYERSSGGDAAGGNLRQSTYSANNLNQYTQRTVPGAIDIIGTAATAAAVTVNDQPTYRRVDYFHKALALDNSAAPVYSQVNIVGAKNAAGPSGEDVVTQKSGFAYLAKALEPYIYDADGNLISDGRFNYTWDAENRLVRLETSAEVPGVAKKRLEFAYDCMSRRIQKKVYGWNPVTSTYQLLTTTKFVYEGWNLIAELDAGNVLLRAYVRSGQEMLMVNGSGNVYESQIEGEQNIGGLVKASTAE